MLAKILGFICNCNNFINLLPVPEFSKYGSFADNDSGLDGYGETNSFLHQNLVSHHL
jgi:hypothetical protein